MPFLFNATPIYVTNAPPITTVHCNVLYHKTNCTGLVWGMLNEWAILMQLALTHVMTHASVHFYCITIQQSFVNGL